MIPKVAASEMGEAQTIVLSGMMGFRTDISLNKYSRTQLESWTKEGDSPVDEILKKIVRIQSTVGHEESCRNIRRTISKG